MISSGLVSDALLMCFIFMGTLSQIWGCRLLRFRRDVLIRLDYNLIFLIHFLFSSILVDMVFFSH